MLFFNIFDLFWYLHNTDNDGDWNSSKTVYKLPTFDESKIRKSQYNTSSKHKVQ